MRLRSHFNYANVMSTLAVFLVLAGGSFALAKVGKNEVRSKQVKNNTLKSQDLKDGKGVTGKDVKDGSLDGADVGDGSLTGSDIGPDSLTGANVDESTLGKVPDADALDGLDSSDLEQIKGQGKLDLVPKDSILTVEAIGLEVETDGDAQDDLEVRLRNASTTGMGQLFNGEGNVSVIVPGDSVLVTPDGYGATYTDFGGDVDTFENAPRLDAVVSQGTTRVWIECVFPVDEVLCRATVFP